MKNKKIIIISICILIITTIIFFIKNYYKFSKNGNNISNKSADDIKNYILNIESYCAVASITVKSNKNENTYKMEQKYNKTSNSYLQEILEPSNIAGTKIIYNGQTLTIENTKLNLKKIYENYPYLESNELSLAAFIEDFKNLDGHIYDENGIIILETNAKNETQYKLSKKLYINKEQGKIEKMEIIDRTQNARVYILYNEIELNTLSNDEVFAFLEETLEANI